VIRVATVLLVFLSGLQPARAQGRLGVGICVPEIPFNGALARHRAARRVAQHLARALRRPVEGLAYLHPKDMRRDIRAGVLHFAVVGAMFAATMPDDQILAQGRLANSAAGIWSVLCRSKRSLKDCQGKRLQIADMGPETLKFVEDGVLGGKLKVQSHFKVQWSPNLLSAEMAVVLNQADAVIAPVSTAGLVPLVKGYAVPPPAFVLVNRQVPPEVVEKARNALLSFTATIGTLKGWDPPSPGAYRKLVAFAPQEELRMKLAPLQGTPLGIGDLIKGAVLQPDMPELDEPLEVP
jgi:hypothetical protein